MNEKIRLSVRNDYLFFGGCYSNLEATQRMKEISDELGFSPSQICCTGDVVGYCADPEETVQLIRDWGIEVIAGNVEIQLASGEDDCGCNFDEDSACNIYSKSWFPFAAQNVSKESIMWMQELPLQLSKTIQGKKLIVIHGAKPDISEFIFESTSIERKLEILEFLNADIIISGHSGLPFQQEISDKKWINAGVVGMPPNDGTQTAWFAVLRGENLEVELHSFTYDSEKAQQKMEEVKLPTAYSKTLTTGIWDNCDILPEQETKQQGIKLIPFCHHHQK